MKGKLAAMLAHSEPFEFREYEVPEVGDDDIIVKISTTNICGSDVHLWHGRGLKLPELPVVLGHEAVGIVHAVGKNVSGDSYGDSCWHEVWSSICVWGTWTRDRSVAFCPVSRKVNCPDNRCLVSNALTTATKC